MMGSDGFSGFMEAPFKKISSRLMLWTPKIWQKLRMAHLRGLPQSFGVWADSGCFPTRATTSEQPRTRPTNSDHIGMTMIMVEVMVRMGMIMLTRVTWRGLVLCLNWSENNKWQDWTKIEVQIHGTPYQCTAKVSACSVTRYMYQQQLHFEQDIDQKQEERK